VLRSFTPTPQDAEDAAFAAKAVPSFKKIAGVTPSLTREVWCLN